MIDFGVEEHRIRNEKEFGVYLDFICEGVKGHPVFGIGDITKMIWKNFGGG